MAEIPGVRAALAVSMLAMFTAAAASAEPHEPYHIMADSPVHITGAGNEVVRVYGEAPDAQWVEITIHDTTYESAVRGGSFHITAPAPPPGTYGITGIWQSSHMEPAAGGVAETVTTGHLADGILTVLGRGYGDVPAGTVTISRGAHEEGCAGCVDGPTDMVEAGGYVLVSNADAERHQFATHDAWAAESTGNLDPGESVRLPFNSQGVATYRCVYHPWLEFEVRATGTYVPPEEPGTLLLEAPGHAGDAVRVRITHTGAAAVAHTVFIQDGQVLAAGTAPLAGGYGTYVADASEWRVGEVVVSVSAGADHATETISVRPPPGAAERSGRITGYDGPDGILIDGGLARPAGMIPLDAASGATRQVCPLGGEALFRADMGLAPRGAQHSSGSVWCAGTNLGVYLLESGLAITDPAECGLARAEWLAPYCFPETGAAGQPGLPAPQEGADAADPTCPADDQDSDVTVAVADPGAPDGAGDVGAPDAPDAPDTVDAPDTMPGDLPAVPSDVAEPDVPGMEGNDTCDHYTNPECPCPEGWVRNGEWCDPDWHGGIGAAADVAGGAAGDAGDAASGAAGGIRDGMVDAVGGFFGWIAEGMAEIPRLFLALGEWMADLWGI